jgi:hypothetical protein
MRKVEQTGQMPGRGKSGRAEDAESMKNVNIAGFGTVLRSNIAEPNDINGTA